MANRVKRYCAFCKNKRTFYLKKHVGVIDFVACLLASLALMIVIWQDFDPRFLLFLAAGVALTEVFILLRWRVKMICEICGFDPLLYKRDAGAAASSVKQYMSLRENDPRNWLKPRPKLQALRVPPKKAKTSPKSSPNLEQKSP